MQGAVGVERGYDVLQEQQEAKKKTKQVINYEKEIMALEARAAELEEMFATTSDPELYREYNQLQEDIGHLYDQWEQSSHV